MRAVGWIITLVAGTTSMFFGQAKTPQGALEEIATAEHPEAIARHLPDPVQKKIEDLAPGEKQKVMEALLSSKNERLDDRRLRRANDSEGWELVDNDGDTRAKIKVANVFFSGVEALLSLEIDEDNSPQMVIVSMHLEGSDWRIDNYGPWMKQGLGLKKMLHVPTQADKNDEAAREALQQISAALDRYTSRFPERGYPSSLKQLTVANEPTIPGTQFGTEPFLDASYAAEPLVIQGYELRYRLTAAGGQVLTTGHHMRLSAGQFELTATPLEYGKTGTRSFFMDQGGTIRATSENRPAREDDPSLDDDALVEMY